MSTQPSLPSLPLPTSPEVARAARHAASERATTVFAAPDKWERIYAHAFRLASVYPITDDTVEVCVSLDALTYAAGGDLPTADSIADGAATVILDLAAERASVPLSRGRIDTVAPGVLRLTWAA